MQINITISKEIGKPSESNLVVSIITNVFSSFTNDNLIDSSTRPENKLITNIINAAKACDLVNLSTTHSYDSTIGSFVTLPHSIFRTRVRTDASIPRANCLIIESDFGGAVEILIDDLPCVYTVDGFKLMIFKELFNVALKEKVEDEF